ncbi:MAG: hypothetical protein U0271_02820 [Polyangiaceae bacterium]
MTATATASADADEDPALTAEPVSDERVSTGCGGFHFVLTPGRVVAAESDHGRGVMQAKLAVYRQGESVQTVSLSIDNNSGFLDPEVVCGDFNFDGHEDFAVNDADSGSYGSPSYAVFLYQPRRKAYVLSPELSRLTEESLGFPTVDSSKRRLMASSKSGCCIHWHSEYAVVGDVPLRMKTVTDEDSANGSCLVTTELRGKDGAWRQSRRSLRHPCPPDESDELAADAR